ncbi:MAG: RnfABCDGE type electron transport complex subunit B [Cyclobacteriaceae bacterium]|nr:RnfABCDGE type electron transport complex subunit B [Cyclobacteriaceae bacterium]
MNDVILNTVLILVSLGIVAAIILYFVSQKFKVEEDPRLEKVLDTLPGTNCGGCGFPGCSGFANALIGADDLAPYHCPVGGNEVMKEVAGILGMEVEEKDPFIAIVKCAGAIGVRKHITAYDGAANCTIASDLYSGERGCSDGCVGLGECVDACDFQAMYMDEYTGLPVVLEDKCTACNACVKACPKHIIQLWPKGKKDKRIYVACVNEDKGGSARKDCSLACTGCAKCAEECKYDAITVENNLATIDFATCKLCGKCVVACDVRNIVADHFSKEQLDKLADKREARLEKEKEARIAERKKNKEEALSEKNQETENPSTKTGTTDAI